MKGGFFTEEYERCILCGTLTDVPVSMPVDLRENYEIGLGQLCSDCAFLQVKSAILTTEQITLAVEQSRDK